ncbi:uncharacterized protein N7483_009284 [Penicillium malachiteum]|uniref:uncharacterized protein n=1 Tax=Penicillium malachiteum TaxID=1324776 RepID=UPI0025468D59|nr:uncharacterized protein N7483_009284 [Penicillium malachiteum]KAJ5721350.1 hypothetical protein N7483_009284 [Penicillium malachiteum]
MATKDAAKQDVIAIAKDYGFINPSDLNEIGQIRAAFRREVEVGMWAKDKKIAHSITTLAKNVYSSNARFIFELLQNADDNQFKLAVSRDEQPFISFKVFPDKIIIECNEDGFTKANLSAICSVGESTKAASHGYIGAKGIGFKSVFIAAWKVEIQSGNYSFYFKHDRGDLGIGMILPVWQDVSDELPNSLTRITLHLHQKGDPEDIDHLHQTIFKQLNDLEPTCLLFLRKLKEIRVSFYDQDEELQRSKMFYLKGNTTGIVSLTTESTDEHGEENINISKYYVTRYIGSRLPKSDNRELPATIEAETVLAFPMGQDNQPLFAPQSVFAFLPIQKTSFKFLIQSDFDTSASRQKISSTSRRNIKLLDHIAAAFCQAVLYFTSNKDFLHTWPMYLPSPEDATETFWSELHLKILASISQHRIIHTQFNKLAKIAQVVIPAQSFKDDHGNVLLNHYEIDPFICDHYSKEAISSLQHYGLKINRAGLVMRILKKDLESPFSRVKWNNLSEDFQSRMAKLLSQFAKESESIRSELSSLTLLPLRNGHWVSFSSGSVSFPHSNGIVIPPGLDFRILDPVATSNPDRKAFFSILGIQEPAVDTVRESILKRNCSSFLDEHSTIGESKKHLVFLYQAHRFPTTAFGKGNMLRNIHIFSDELRLICPRRDGLECYAPSNDPYGPKLLLGATDALPGMKLPFVHPKYLEETPEKPSPDHPSWIEWFKETFGVSERLSLIARDGHSLSPTWYYLAKHQPQKLLGYLKQAWKFEGAQIICSESLKLLLQKTDVSRLSNCIVKLPRQCRLDEAYLPLPNLVEQSRVFLGKNDAFPFLHLKGMSSEEQIKTNWFFLHSELGVKKDDDIEFLLDILKWLKISNSNFLMNKHVQRVFDLYSAIFTKYSGSRDKMQLRERISSFFKSDDYIYAPRFARASVTVATCPRWISTELCLLKGPENLISKYPLETRYRRSSADEKKLSSIMNLFSQVLNINSPSWHDLIVELAYHRDHQNDPYFTSFTPSSIFDLYKCIHGMNSVLSVKELRREFHENSLIFVKTDSQTGWYKSSECLWSSTTEIRGKVALNDHYNELEEFFLHTLGVQTLTLQMAYDDLLAICSEATREEIISKLWCLNALLLMDDTYVDPKPLLRKPIFPVVFPDGSNALCSTDTEFAIGDREYLASRFRGKIKILEFTQEEVRSLKPFFDWTNLSHRYLSASLKPLTSISGKTTPFNPSPMRDLTRKAHALLRIACSFNSPRYQANRLELYNLLQMVTFEVSDSIVSILRIVQDGRAADVEETIAKLHISETPLGLIIYIPRDRKAQEICFCDILPKNIVDWLMRDPKTQILEPFGPDMLKIVIMMFSIHPFAIDSVLDREGIAEIDIANEDNRSHGDLPEEDDLSSEDSAQSDADRNELFGQPAYIETSTTQNVRFLAQSFATRILTKFKEPVPRENPPIPAPFLNVPLSYNFQYRCLLDHVLLAARRMVFPSRGAFSMAQLNQALPREEELGQHHGWDGLRRVSFFSNNQPQFERDKKIGAAGELYVFELLKGLSLPDWSDLNWRSIIRQYVTIHPDYARMALWHETETAEIVYNDTEGIFTALLIERGYMEAGEWKTMRPKYFMNIKTTTGPVGTPFYLSKNQFERMGNKNRRGGWSEVYLILRVFEIRGSSIGMRVYLDPDQLRMEGGLVSTIGTWQD